jgi:hypothetical protein
MTNPSKKNKARIVSVHYVHDPDAASKWVELLIEITKRQFLDHCLNKDK